MTLFLTEVYFYILTTRLGFSHFVSTLEFRTSLHSLHGSFLAWKNKLSENKNLVYHKGESGCFDQESMPGHF